MSSRIIANFPVPFKRELFYHTIARAWNQMSGLSEKSKYELLLGKPHWINSYIPKHVAVLSQRLGGILTPEEIMSENTIFPYYNLFLTARQQRNFEAGYLKGEKKTSIPWFYNPNLKPGGLRYCPLCVLEQGENVYPRVEWHLPGIDVCPVHHCYLEDYPLSEEEKENDQFIVFKSHRLSAQAKFCQNQAINKLASLSAELFGYAPLLYCQYDIGQRIKILLQRMEYYNGTTPNIQKIHADLVDYYSIDFLNQLDALIEEGTDPYSNWIGKILSVSPKTVDPIYWLLLIGFLCPSINSFFKTKLLRDNYSKGFSEARKFCPNPYCPNYGKLSDISLLSVGKSYDKGIREVFRCNECQVVYSVINGKVAHILQPGPLWHNALREKRENGQKKYLLAKEFKIKPGSVNRYLEQEDLTPFDTKIKELRKLALEFRIEPGKDFVKGFITKYPREYRYLRLNDSVWLNRVHSYGHKDKFINPDIYLRIEDHRILSRLMQAAETIKERGDTQVSSKLLIESAGFDPLMITECYPKSREFIANFLKDYLDFKD